VFAELIVQNATAAGVLLGGTLLLGLTRLRWWAALPVLLGSLGLILGMGSLPEPPLTAFPGRGLLTLLLWLAFGVAARAARPLLPRSLGVAAVVAGALMGDLAAALLLAPQARDARTAARVGLCCAAGGLLSPMGTPATLLLVEASLLAPIALPLALLAWPRGQRDQAGSLPATGLLATLTVLASVLPELRLPLLALGAAMLAALGRARLRPILAETPMALFGWLVAAAVAAWAALHLGLLQQIQVGLETTLDVLPDQGPVLVAGAASLVSLLAGEGAGALLLEATLGATWTGPSESLPTALALGLAVGGVGPAWLALGAGGHRLAERLRWLALPLALQLAAALLWLTWFL
jgi:hypothetical protein